MRKKKLIAILTLALLLVSLASIIPATPALASPVIELNQYVGPVGTTVYVTGTGFSGTWLTTIKFGSISNVLTSPVYITDKDFSAAFVVPTLPRSTNTVTAVSDLGSTDSAVSATSFSVTPSVTLATSSGPIGTKVVVNGSGFTASGTLTGYVDSLAAGTGKTAANGTISSLTLTIPSISGGSHIIYVTDVTGPSPGVGFTVQPQFNASISQSGTSYIATVSGNGFAAQSSVSLTVDGIPVAGTAATDSWGTLPSTQLTLPAVSAGSHSLVATDPAGHSGAVVISTSSTVSISPTSGPVGSQVTLTGSGFGSGKIITVDYDGNPVPISPAVISNSNGGFTANFAIPNSASGTYTVAAADNSGSSSTRFTATAALAPTGATSGPVGTDIPLNGNGFNAAANVNIKYDSNTIATTKTDANGSFSSTVKLQPGVAGQHKIVATDGINSVSFKVSLTPASHCSVSKGNIGTDITVSGNAYTPGDTINIQYDTTALSPATVDANGSFSATFKAPSGKIGDHSIVVADGLISNTFTFTETAAAVSAPLAAFPLVNSKLDASTIFQWNSISSANGPVTYDLQISTDSEFADIIIDKPGLTATAYQLAPEENALLKPAGQGDPYFWRVNATDAAGTTSQWSLPSTFTFGSAFPFWIYDAIYGATALLVFVLGYLIGKRFPGFKPNFGFITRLLKREPNP